MQINETIKSWRWRIVRVEMSQDSFCDTIQVSRAALSNYISGKKDPSLKSYQKIEGKLLELEKEKGII